MKDVLARIKALVTEASDKPEVEALLKKVEKFAADVEREMEAMSTEARGLQKKYEKLSEPVKDYEYGGMTRRNQSKLSALLGELGYSLASKSRTIRKAVEDEIDSIRAAKD